MTKSSILIVEDNEHLRKILATILRFYGYEISETTTGRQAIKKAVVTNPHLILLDLGLPDIRGVEVGGAIKENPATAHIPIIACAASLRQQDREEALRAGMVDSLLKPISAALIKTKIEEFIITERRSSDAAIPFLIGPRKARPSCG